MKKLLGVVMGLLAAMLIGIAPARAIEPVGALAVGVIVIGPHLVRELHAAGKLPANLPACRVETVKAQGGGYSYEIVPANQPPCEYDSPLKG